MTRGKATFSNAAEDSWGTGTRQQSEMDLDITPMIDVTFLLLIFFMVTSSMQADKDFEVPVARHGLNVETASSTIIEIHNPPGTATPQPEIVLGPNANATLEDVGGFVRAGLQKNRTNVVIKADRGVPHGFVQEVIKVVDSIEGARFYIGVRDKPSD